MRHESLSSNVRDHERAAFRWLGEASELDLEVDEQGVAAAPSMGEDLVGDPREFGHDAEFLRAGEAAAHDLAGLDERVVLGVVLDEELDHARHDDGAASDAGHALDERAGRDAADDDLERDHRGAPDAHLVVVVVLASAEIVGRQTAEVQQPEDARGRDRREAALSFDRVAARAVAGGDVVELRDDEETSECSGLSCRTLVFPRATSRPLFMSPPTPAVAGTRETVDTLDEGARAFRRVADIARRVEQRARLGRIEQRGDARIVGEQRGSGLSPPRASAS